MTTHADRIALTLRLQRKIRGIPVTLVRKDDIRVDITKVIKTTPVAETSSNSGTARRMQTVAFLIAVEDLTHDDELFKPEKDQTIEVLIGGGTQKEIYRVQPFSSGSGRAGEVFEYSDAAGTQFRIHANYHKTEAVEE